MSLNTDSSLLEDGVHSISGRVMRGNVGLATLWIMRLYALYLFIQPSFAYVSTGALWRRMG